MSEEFRLQSLVGWLWFGTKVIGGLVVTVAALLYTNQEKLLYFPKPPGTPPTPEESPAGCKSPSEWNKRGYSVYDPRPDHSADPIPYEDIMIETIDGEKLHSWLLLQDDSELVPTLIYFHGNAGHIGFRLQNAADMYGSSKFNVLMVDYRGYGKSSGAPTESGLQIDGEAVLDFALRHPKLNKNSIVLFGRSLGGSVAIHLAEKHPDKVAAVIVENTYLSISAMVDVIMPFLRSLKPFVLRMKWDSENAIKNVTQPILFISGDSDELVPPFHMKRLFELAKSSTRREFYSVSGGTHNDTWYRAGPAYYEKLKDFMESFFVVKTLLSSERPVCQTEQPKIKSNSKDLGNDEVDEDDYLVVNEPKLAIPTMDKSFRIH